MTPSITAENRYRFKCPTTGREELYIRCATRRHIHWRGGKIEGDCATCMRSSKCAALHMLNEEWRTNKAVFFDREAATHRLPSRILDRTKVIQVLRSHGSGTGIDPVALEALVRGDFDGSVGNRYVPAASMAELEVEKGSAEANRARASKTPAKLGSILDEVDTDMAGQLNRSVGQ